MKVKGSITREELSRRVEVGDIETVIMGFADHYGRLLGKRFDADFFLESGLTDGTHCCNYLLTTDMEMEPVQGYKSANWELGYGDFHLLPDIKTLRIVDWQEKTAIIMCDVEAAEAPRTILNAQLAELRKHGYSCMAASELEHYLFDTSYRQAAQQNHNEIKSAGWYLEDYHILQGTRTEKYHAAVRRHLKNSGIPVETSKGEWGRGQHEINIRYAEVREMADRHVLFKQCLKEVADQQELSVTFMAKYDENQAGSSCHIHLSLWKGDENAFDGDKKVGPVKGSDVFRWFLGGWIKHVPDVMPFYAPTVNSYKRYVDGSWAPTRLAWSYDNRTAGFRVVGEGKSLRIECRIPGADCNPYLAFAAALASGLDGIRNKIEPPEIFEGDIYSAQDLPRVAHTLKAANRTFKESEFTRTTFGNAIVDHYAHHFANEVKAHEQAVSDWERKRYFERI